MPLTPLDPVDAATAAAELVTVRDFVRHATTAFTAAGLVFGHGTATALDEAVYMVLETLHLPIDDVGPFMEARLTTPERVYLARLIADRVATRKPAPYLTGRAYIQGIPFRVDERVIVPRSYIGEMLFSGLFTGGGPDEGPSVIDDPEEVESVLDLCTGSGCLAILAAHVFPNAEVTGVDLSPQALEVAALNVQDHDLGDRVTLHQGDLFAPIKKKKFDLIITNPPYVDAEAMAALPPEFRHEPAMALAGGDDGLDIVRRILTHAAAHLTPTGGLVCEIGTGRYVLEAEYPDVEFLWLDSADSAGEVFWLTAEQLKEI